MKQKIFSLLVLLMAAVTGAWADETTTVTWGATQLESIGNLAIGESKTAEGITITVLEGSHPSAPIQKNMTYYSSEISIMQFIGYKGTNDFQFTSTIGNITKIEMASMNQPAAGDGWSNGVWTGNASTVYFGGSVATQQVVFTIEKAPFDYEFTELAADHGSGKFAFYIDGNKVDGAYAADAGKTVTMTVTPDAGWIVDDTKVKAESYSTWEAAGAPSRRSAPENITILGDVTLNKSTTAENTWTFTMPAASVLVSAGYQKSSTLYFDPAKKTDLMKVTVGGTDRNLDAQDNTVKIAKVENVLEGTAVTLTANQGYKFRKVAVKKGKPEAPEYADKLTEISGDNALNGVASINETITRDQALALAQYLASQTGADCLVMYGAKPTSPNPSATVSAVDNNGNDRSVYYKKAISSSEQTGLSAYGNKVYYVAQ